MHEVDPRRAVYASKTVVLMVGERFFAGFSPSGRARTAWSLAGAKHFGAWDWNGVMKAEMRLKKKGYDPILRDVELLPPLTQRSN